MANHESETLRLINAIPVPDDRHEIWVPGECPLAFDASGTQATYFETAALNPDVAQALQDGCARINFEAEKKLAVEANFHDPQRMGEYARCLLRRASGECLVYDAEKQKDRSDKEISERLKVFSEELRAFND